MTYAIPYHFRMLMQGYITERGGDWDAIDPAAIQRVYDEASVIAGTVGMFKTMDGPHPSQQHVVTELDKILAEQRAEAAEWEIIAHEEEQSDGK